MTGLIFRETSSKSNASLSENPYTLKFLKENHSPLMVCHVFKDVEIYCLLDLFRNSENRFPF